LPQPLNIVLVRVDNRLVHGQLLEAWIPYLKAGCVIVVSDEAAADFFHETVIRMAVPNEIEVLVIGVEDFSREFPFTEGQGKNTVVLFSNIAGAARAYDRGFRFTSLNIGNVYDENCILCCSRSVLLSEQDIDLISTLINEKGVTVELRGVPRDEPEDFRNIIRQANRTES